MHRADDRVETQSDLRRSAEQVAVDVLASDARRQRATNRTARGAKSLGAQLRVRVRPKRANQFGPRRTALRLQRQILHDLRIPAAQEADFDAVVNDAETSEHVEHKR